MLFGSLPRFGALAAAGGLFECQRTTVVCATHRAVGELLRADVAGDAPGHQAGDAPADWTGPKPSGVSSVPALAGRDTATLRSEVGTV